MKCFVIALMAEANPLLSLLEEAKEKNIHALKIVSGKLFGQLVHIVISGVGKVNAARATQYAIDTLKATSIINIGTSGALVDSLSIGEVCEVEDVVQYDFDLVQINGTSIGTLNEFPSPYLPLVVPAEFTCVVCATGDRFNDSEADYELIRSLGCSIRDMELGAIAQVCAHADVKLFSFKVISDIHGSSSSTEQYTQNLQKCAQSLKDQIKKIMDITNG